MRLHYLILAAFSVLILGCGDDKKEASTAANAVTPTTINHPINHPLTNAIANQPLFSQQKALIAANSVRLLAMMNALSLNTSQVQIVANCVHSVMAPLTVADVTTLPGSEGIELAAATLAALNTCIGGTTYSITRANTIMGNRSVGLALSSSTDNVRLISTREDFEAAVHSDLVLPANLDPACLQDPRLQKASLTTASNSIFRMNGVSAEYIPDPNNFIAQVYAFWSETCSFVGIQSQ